jgi:hypothetical protein
MYNGQKKKTHSHWGKKNMPIQINTTSQPIETDTTGKKTKELKQKKNYGPCQTKIRPGS